MAIGRLDRGRHSRWFGAGGIVGARPTQAKESAAGTALVAVSEDALQPRQRRILLDVARAFAGA